jgi:hypothetical protein
MTPTISRPKVLCLAGAVALMQLPTSARADAIVDRQAQVDALLKEIAALEENEPAARDASPAAPTAPSNVLTGGATKGSFKLPGSNTSATLGGYVKPGAIFSDRSAGVASTGDQEYEAGSVPVGGGSVHLLTVGANTATRGPLPITPRARGELFVEPHLSSVSSPSAFELRFRSLSLSEPGFAFPCDADGHVPIDDLSDRLRNNYFYARAVVGSELSWPVVAAVRA